MIYKENQVFEKRGSPRINWVSSEVQVIIESLSNSSKILGWVQNISQGGFRVRVETPENFRGLFEKWEEFHFETFGNFFQLKGQGRIAWISSNENMAGIKFDQLQEESRRFLDGFLGILP
ncbi:MAG: hypothetical protein A2157_03715 [Deltaproteobacteria bacterium RBG_16_47_11]|nr:MAG: hypothetical protein A2157_03715 [Deltaproteobacteria bacterium RBG_16_47_11]